MVYIKMNLSTNRTYLQGIIYYIENTVNIEPGRDIDTKYGELYNYVGNTFDTSPEDLYKI